MMRVACFRSAVGCAIALLAVAACDRPDADGAGERSADSRETTQPSADWPAAGGSVDLRRERRIDLTGDGREEMVTVTARGARYDSLEIALAVIGAQRDTLWLERWPSLLYFKYQPIEELDDSAVVRIVRSHVDSLIADDRFTTAGPPPRLSQGTGALDMSREAVRYHLAELDWRGMADLTPADELPPEAHHRIDAQRVAPERVTVVIDELRPRPSFWYFAGGEATYAIAWSEREHAFVRIFACC
jgi:hypothetical protein